jgi:type I restriction enzyme S subunit
MEVTRGYKQTEMWVIPEDWSLQELESISIISRLAGAEYTSLWKETPDGEIIALRGFNIGKGRIIERELVRISNELSLKLKRSRLCKGDVVYPCVGSIGNAAVITEDNKYHIQQNIARITPNPAAISSRYLANYLMSSLGEMEVARLNASSSQPSVLVGSLRQYRIPLPPTKAEQEAIAEVLSDADALIESLEQLLTKKRQLKQGAMQELLTGKKRLPGFSEKWEVKRLGELAEIVMGQSPSSAHYNNRGDGLPLIQGNADISGRQTIKRVFTTEVTKRGRSGDILMSVRAPVGEISRAVFDVCLGRGVCAIRHPNDFLYYALIAKEPTWSTLSKGSTFDSVSSTDVRAFEVDVPADESEQTAIAAILSDMDAEIAALEAKLAKARSIKQGMMQELLTGRIRLV